VDFPEAVPAASVPASSEHDPSVERRILRSTARLIESGTTWHALSIRQITDRAAISRTAFYDFFRSKNDVLRHLISDLDVQLTTIITPSGETLVVDPTAGVPELLGVTTRFFVENGVIYRAFLDATTEDPQLDALWDEMITGYLEFVSAAIDGFRATHPAAPSEPASADLAKVLVMMTERVMLLMLRRPAEDHRAMIDALQVVWLRSIYAAPDFPAT
jgi:AcrR family transcriptional regulator